MESFDVALLIFRLWLGSVMLAHGINHARNLDGTASWFAAKGFRLADLNARGSAFGEIAIGLALIAGLLTTPAAAGLTATMTVAFGSIHRFAGFFVFERPDEGWEYVRRVDPDRLHRDEALAFWINLYNAGALIVAGEALGAGKDSVLGTARTDWYRFPGSSCGMAPISSGPTACPRCCPLPGVGCWAPSVSGSSRRRRSGSRSAGPAWSSRITTGGWPAPSADRRCTELHDLERID